MDQPPSINDSAEHANELASVANDVEIILESWRKSLVRRTRLYNWFSWMLLIGGGLYCWQYFVAAIPGLPALDEIYLAVMGLLYSTGLFLNVLSTRRTVKQINNAEGKRFVGPLIEMAFPYGQLRVGRKIRYAAAKALIRLLPQLTDADSSQISDSRRRILRRMLDRFGTEDHEFTVAVLKAWGQIGGQQELPTIEYLAEGLWAVHNTAEIREAAKACLPYVKARAEAEKQRETLLRPASSSEIEEPILLRPAASAAQATEEQLLRPAE